VILVALVPEVLSDQWVPWDLLVLKVSEVTWDLRVIWAILVPVDPKEIQVPEVHKGRED
jgi:hypothetical protein